MATRRWVFLCIYFTANNNNNICGINCLRRICELLEFLCTTRRRQWTYLLLHAENKTKNSKLGLFFSCTLIISYKSKITGLFWTAHVYCVSFRGNNTKAGSLRNAIKSRWNKSSYIMSYKKKNAPTGFKTFTPLQNILVWIAVNIFLVIPFEEEESNAWSCTLQVWINYIHYMYIVLLTTWSSLKCFNF